jgi:ketosteroid isomerase-like protein
MVKSGRWMALCSVLAIGGAVMAVSEEAKSGRKEVEAAYRQYKQAVQKRDVRAIMTLLTPDFTWKLPDGTVYTYRQTEQVLREYFADIKTVHSMTIRIHRLTVEREKAVALVTEKVVATNADSRRSESREQYREIWARTAQGWKIRRTEPFDEKELLNGRHAADSAGK